MDPEGQVDEEYTLDDAREILYELIVDLKVRSKISATDACILSYWAVMAGASGESLKKLAKPPRRCQHGPLQ